jgi:hypothetical protein
MRVGIGETGEDASPNGLAAHNLDQSHPLTGKISSWHKRARDMDF